jgi:transcriptional regulator with XRE-family HTH domain
MKSAGAMLKETRIRLNLRYRDVEEASHKIARLHGNDEFIIALSRLADIENKGTLPTIYRLYSLCVIYRLGLKDVLNWYGVPVDSLRGDSLICRQPSTHLLPPEIRTSDSSSELTDPPSDGAVLPEPTIRSTPYPEFGPAESWLARSVMRGLPRRSMRLGMIGEQDYSMSPIIPPGSVVMIDDRRKRVARSGWTSEVDRPIYFLETREGYLCRWCTVQEADLIAIPHPSSNLSPQKYAYPAEVDVVGEVVGVAMQRPLVRSPRTRS